MSLPKLLLQMTWTLFFEIFVPMALVCLPVYWLFNKGLSMMIAYRVPLWMGEQASIYYIAWLGTCFALVCVSYMKLSQYLSFVADRYIKPKLVFINQESEISN